MQILNLTKYITEITTAIVEVKLKVTDIQSIVELCSLLHQRYSDFSQPFLEAWSKALSVKKEDKNFNVSKLRVDLRLYCDLLSVGIFPLKEGLSLLGNVLTTLITNDKVHSIQLQLLRVYDASAFPSIWVRYSFINQSFPMINILYLHKCL